MPSEHLQFGGGAIQSVYSRFVLLLAIVVGLLVLLRPRAPGSSAVASTRSILPSSFFRYLVFQMAAYRRLLSLGRHFWGCLLMAGPALARVVKHFDVAKQEWLVGATGATTPTQKDLECRV